MESIFTPALTFAGKIARFEPVGVLVEKPVCFSSDLDGV
jgi:hypothetical protein